MTSNYKTTPPPSRDRREMMLGDKPKRIVIESTGLTVEDAIAHALSVISGIVRGSTDCTCGGSSGSASGKVSDV